jgi:cytochrome c biogenesis protein CcmG/thiol:disulfide interchange protein DsbE
MNASSRAGRWLPLAVFGLLALLLGAGVWLSRRADRDALPSPLIGKAAPAFSLPVLHEPGRMLTLDQLKGQPFVLNVWASWCVSCRVEHPVLTRFAETRRVRVVGYDWKDERADAVGWLAHFGNPFWMVLVDYEARYAIDWGI